jgi:flavin-dependent dehydrogenase
MVRKLVKERVMLFGDAAGMCKPTTGGGIGPGIWHIETVHFALAAAVTADRLSLKDLQRLSKPLKKMRKEQERARVLRNLFLTDCDDEKLERTFTTFAKPEVVALINKVGDIEKPVPLGLRMLKDVPEFRSMAAQATWALLTSKGE